MLEHSVPGQVQEHVPNLGIEWRKSASFRPRPRSRGVHPAGEISVLEEELHQRRAVGSGVADNSNVPQSAYIPGVPLVQSYHLTRFIVVQLDL